MRDDKSRRRRANWKTPLPSSPSDSPAPHRSRKPRTLARSTNGLVKFNLDCAGDCSSGNIVAVLRHWLSDAKLWLSLIVAVDPFVSKVFWSPVSNRDCRISVPPHDVNKYASWPRGELSLANSAIVAIGATSEHVCWLVIVSSPPTHAALHWTLS